MLGALYTTAVDVPYEISQTQTEQLINFTGIEHLDFTESQSPTLEDFSQCTAEWMDGTAQMPSERPCGTSLMSYLHRAPELEQKL